MDPVIVVGGGIVGTSVAYHLCRRGAPVRLYERDDLGSGTTARSSLGFRQYGTNALQVRMKRYGKRCYNDLMATAGSGLQYRPTEVVAVATTAAGRERLVERQAAEHPDSSVSELLEGTELRDVVMLPEVDASAVTAAHYRPNAGFFLSASSLVRAFADRAAADGATIATRTAVTDLLTRDGRVHGVVVDGEPQPASAVVAAAGPWNNALAAMADTAIPVRQQRLHTLELAPGRRLSRPLPKLRHIETGVMFRGRPDGRVLVYHSPPADDPYDAATDSDPDAPVGVPESVVETMLESVGTLVPTLADATIVDEGVAYTSRTPDGNPIVGWTDTPGFLLAAVHSRGIQYAPAVGDIVAGQVVDGDPTDYYPDVSVGRFEGYTERRE